MAKVNKDKNILALPYVDNPGQCNHCGIDISEPIFYNSIVYSMRYFCPQCYFQKVTKGLIDDDWIYGMTEECEDYDSAVDYFGE